MNGADKENTNQSQLGKSEIASLTVTNGRGASPIRGCLGLTISPLSKAISSVTLLKLCVRIGNSGRTSPDFAPQRKNRFLDCGAP